MMESRIRKLAEYYREDLRDYEIILAKMQAFESFLESQPGTGEIAKMDGEQVFEQELAAFVILREETYRRLQERSLQAGEIQKAICSEAGLAKFQVSGLRPYLSAELDQELGRLTDEIKQKMNEILKIDNRLIPRLRMELEAVKLELHRLQGAQKTKNAYGSPGSKEARFIDKSK